jgi:polyisoprenoid-binding protein YceI
MTRLQISNPRVLAGAAVTLSLALLPGVVRIDAAGAALQLDSARVTIHGTSNVHPYEASTKTVKVTRVQVSSAVADEAVEALAGPAAIDAFEIAIPAATLSSPKDGLDKNMHKALKVQQFADITFSLTRLERAATPNGFRGVGKLTIAGVEREVVLDLTIQKVGTTISVRGSLPLLMTDYGITPPKAMLGMLKTDPKVTIAFETIFSIPTT